MQTNERYLSIELPNTKATIDFLSDHPVTIKAELDANGKLWITAISNTQDAPILIDEVRDVPTADQD